MLVTLLIVFLLMGGSTPYREHVSQFQSATKHVVTEPARRDAIHAVLKEMTAAIKQNEKDWGKSSKALQKLGGNHAATAAEYHAIMEAQRQDNAAFQEKILTQLHDLKSRLTREEWSAIIAKARLNPAGP